MPLSITVPSTGVLLSIGTDESPPPPPVSALASGDVIVVSSPQAASENESERRAPRKSGEERMERVLNIARPPTRADSTRGVRDAIVRVVVRWIFTAIVVCLPAAGCGGAPRPIQVVGEGTVYRGMVTAVEGHASVAEGQACEVRVAPTDDPRFNCRIQVRCGEEVLYGFPGAGFNRCAEEGGAFVAARDRYKTRADGDPAMGWDQRRHMLLVTDSEPDFQVTLALHAE